MSTTATDLDQMVANCLNALADQAEGGPAAAETTMRERFFELMVLVLGNLYTKTPVAAPLFDRTTMLRVTTGMDDNDAGRLTGRSEDWLRIEGILRQQDGAKAYFLTKGTLAALSTMTSAGTMGDVMDAVLARYQHAMPTEDVRRTMRVLGSWFLANVSVR